MGAQQRWPEEEEDGANEAEGVLGAVRVGGRKRERVGPCRICLKPRGDEAKSSKEAMKLANEIIATEACKPLHLCLCRGF